jgi:hypothetical protein
LFPYQIDWPFNRLCLIAFSTAKKTKPRISSGAFRFAVVVELLDAACAGLRDLKDESTPKDLIKPLQWCWGYLGDTVGDTTGYLLDEAASRPRGRASEKTTATVIALPKRIDAETSVEDRPPSVGVTDQQVQPQGRGTPARLFSFGCRSGKGLGPSSKPPCCPPGRQRLSPGSVGPRGAFSTVLASIRRVH